MTQNRLNVDRLMQALSDILSEKHGADIKFTAKPKEERTHEQRENRPA
jgi:hypothetical protein